MRALETRSMVDSKEILYYKYHTFSDFLDDAKVLAEDAPMSKMHSRNSGNPEFYGTSTWEEAVKLIECGWPQGLTKMNATIENLEIALGRLQENFALTWDVTGDMVDVGAFCSGDPEHMISFPADRSVGKGRIIEISLDICAHGMVSTETFFRRGAVVCALIDYFILRGYGVEVLGYFGVYFKGKIGSIATPIHRAGEILDMDRIAFCCAHASFFRRFFFSLMENLLGINDQSEPGYGRPYHNFQFNSDIVIGGNWYEHCGTDEAAKKFVLDCVQKFNEKEVKDA